MSLNLYFFRASPEQSGYVGGGAGVVCANTPSEALGFILENTSISPYLRHDEPGTHYEEPMFLAPAVEGTKVGILCYEGVSD